MKSFRKELIINIPKRRQIVNITSEIQSFVKETGIVEGLCLIHSLHTTSSIFINDDEEGLHKDLDNLLEKIVPEKPHDQYRHNVDEDNADAHLKRILVGRSETLAITDGKLELGHWERIFYYEFDGKRQKRILIKVIGF